MKTVGEKSITFAEAKELLEKKEIVSKESAKELGYEQKITLEYLRKFSRLDKEKVETAKKSLTDLEGGLLKEHQIITLLDVLPENEDEINMIFVKERLTLTKEQVSKILEILNSIRPKEKKLRKEEKKKVEIEEGKGETVAVEKEKPEKVEKEKAGDKKEEKEKVKEEKASGKEKKTELEEKKEDKGKKAVPKEKEAKEPEAKEPETKEPIEGETPAIIVEEVVEESEEDEEIGAPDGEADGRADEV